MVLRTADFIQKDNQTLRFKVFQISQQDWSFMGRLYYSKQKEDGYEGDRDLESEFETNPLV